jgi:hypothetical protein
MDTTTIIAIAVAVVVLLAVAAAAWTYLSRQRSKKLRENFGPEYQRVVRAEGSERQAEQILEDRQKRLNEFDLKPLTPEEQERFGQRWQQEQARFVDSPRVALKNADRLVTEVMSERGYPMGDFEQRAADVSVHHPIVVENYRVAHSIAVRDREQPVSTEELREAMIHYRALFADLLHDGGMTPVRQVVTENKAKAREAGR